MNNKKKIFTALIPLWALTSCGNSNFTEEGSIFLNNTEVQDYIYKDENKNNQIKNINEEVVIEKKLVINNRCIGCNHCTRISPSNFALNRSSRKAYVVSQENIGSSNVSRAISRCPVGAIEITS